MSVETPVRRIDSPSPAGEALEVEWFESGIFTVRRSSFPPPPASQTPPPPPIGDQTADDWFK